jgi:hypothetical protein
MDLGLLLHNEAASPHLAARFDGNIANRFLEVARHLEQP